jgi:hypothetical protein
MGPLGRFAETLTRTRARACVYELKITVPSVPRTLPAPRVVRNLFRPRIFAVTLSLGVFPHEPKNPVSENDTTAIL